MHAAVYNLNFAVACKAIADHGQSLVSFHVAGALEEFIEYSADRVL